MHTGLSSIRTVGQRSRRIILAIVFALAVSLVLLTAYRSHDGSAQNQRVATEWPSFTMQFTERETDPGTGKTVVDQTVRLAFVDDNTWRADVIADAINPKQVGSFRAVKDNVYYTYSAAGNRYTQAPVEPNTVVAITPDLVPGVYSRIHDGIDKGWATPRAALPAAAAKIASGPTVSEVQQLTTACGTPSAGVAGQGVCGEERRIDFASNTISTGQAAGTQGAIGGVPVYAEYKVNNILIRQFSAQSLSLTSGMTIAAPTTPPGVQTPVITGTGIPVVTVTATPR